MGNLGTRFLRKIPKSEEGLTRISYINVAKTGGKDYYKRLLYSLYEQRCLEKILSSYEATSTFMKLT